MDLKVTVNCEVFLFLWLSILCTISAFSCLIFTLPAFKKQRFWLKQNILKKSLHFCTCSKLHLLATLYNYVHGISNYPCIHGYFLIWVLNRDGSHSWRVDNLTSNSDITSLTLTYARFFSSPFSVLKLLIFQIGTSFRIQFWFVLMLFHLLG